MLPWRRDKNRKPIHHFPFCTAGLIQTTESALNQLSSCRVNRKLQRLKKQNGLKAADEAETTHRLPVFSRISGWTRLPVWSLWTPGSRLPSLPPVSRGCSRRAGRSRGTGGTRLTSLPFLAWRHLEGLSVESSQWGRVYIHSLNVVETTSSLCRILTKGTRTSLQLLL